MSTPEGRIKNMLKRKLDAAFPYHWRFMPVQSGYGRPALDFILCIGGLFVSIETKKDAKSTLTPTQISTSSEILRAGGLVYHVYDEATADVAIAKIHLALRFKCSQLTTPPPAPSNAEFVQAKTPARRQARSKGSNAS